MLNDQRESSNATNLNARNDGVDDDEPPSPIIRDIHALTPPLPPPPPIATVRSSSSSLADSGENFTTISREFNALVLAGSRIQTENNETNLARIGEETNNYLNEETNPLAIVLQDANPPRSPPRSSGDGGTMQQRVKKEEAESKISAWQNAKIAKINNRFKREDAVITGWESERVQVATSRMKKVERKLDEKRAKALERMQNDVAKARRKSEERRATAEAKRGIKMAKVMEIAGLMRAVGRAPAKRSFF